MRHEKPRNVAASVRQRLKQYADARQEDFQTALTGFGLERLLYRLSQSEHRPAFVLKGAMLFRLLGEGVFRPTRDLDFLGRGENSVERVEAIFRAVCAQPVEDDGLLFLAEAVRGERIREDQQYGGIRIHGEARLENARIPVQVDVGFGDAVRRRRRRKSPTRRCSTSRLRRCWPIRGKRSWPRSSRRWLRSA